MATSPSPYTGVQEARSRIAAALRDLRLGADLTGREIARRCGWSPSKSSRIEHGVTPPSGGDIEAWCRACGHPERAADLVAANRQADLHYLEWRRQHRAGLRVIQENSLARYQSTRVLRVYSATVVPGIFQTSGYATALLDGFARFHDAPNDAGQAAAARRRRQRILYEGDHRVVALVDETVLYRRLSGPQVMAEQLSHLIDVSTLPSVALGIVPRDAVWSALWPVETFNIFDNELVTVETLSAKLNIKAPGEIRLYQDAFRELGRMAVYGPAAREAISQAATSLG